MKKDSSDSPERGLAATASPDDGLLASYRFELPPELIAQHPAPERDASRLMELGPRGEIVERLFTALPEALAPGDFLIRNNVRVLPARLIGVRRGGGAAEVLLVRRDDGKETNGNKTAGNGTDKNKNGEDDGETWLCLARPANRFLPGREFSFAGGALIGVAAGRGGDRGMVRMTFSLKGDAFLKALDEFGQIPLPPYIERPDKRPTSEDAERYQTVYAKRPGAVAAPTAGLHFTAAIDRRLAERGVEVGELTLNVGPGTFRPIQAERLDEHRMDAEWYDIPPDVWEKAAAVRRRGGRVVAVGTTTARALESAALAEERGEAALSGWTELFIRPGSRFRVLDGLITNFHLPGSSLLVLISALAGRERVLAAYARAVRERYRFYSYGDAMLIWRPADRE